MHQLRHRIWRLGLLLLLVIFTDTALGVAAEGGAGAAIKLKPGTGPPTIPFTVQGQRFDSNETVDITFDSAGIGSAFTSGSGTFSEKVSVPATAAPGAHTVTAVGEVSGLTASAGFVVRTNWARFHFDNANTGYNPYENVLSTTNVGSLVQKWQVDVGGTYAPSPVVAYGRVYVSSTDGNVLALDERTHAVLWNHATGGSISNWWMSPTAANNLIYIGNDDGVVQALSASTGNAVWSVDLGASVTGAPVVTAQSVYVGAGTRITALDAATGAQTWISPLTYAQGHAPTLSNGLVFTEGNSFVCDVSAFDAATGASVWTRPFCGDEAGTDSETVAASGGQLFVASDWFRDLAATTGSVKWRSLDADRYKTSPVVAGGLVYAGTAEGSVDGLIWAIDTATGSTEWTTDFVGPTHSSPAVANGVLYVGGADGLYAFDASTGALLKKTASVGSGFDGAPAVSDGMVFTSTADGTVYAFGLP